MSHHDDILTQALERFALQGIAATTLQDIAKHADTSKANVLYHFVSKERLIGEALAPCLGALEHLITEAEANGIGDLTAQAGFIERFVDFLITHRLATHIIVSHPYSVETIPSLKAAHELMARMSELVTSHTLGEHDRLRFGVAVSGATYALVSAGLLGVEELNMDDLKKLLTEVLLGMLSAPTTTKVA